MLLSNRCIEPPSPFTQAGLLAVELGHDRPRGDALGVRVAVLAVGRDDVVLVLERGDRADAHGLLPDDQVEEAADLALRVGLRGGLLEAADREHLAVQRRELLGRGLDQLGLVIALDALGLGGTHGGGRHGRDHTHPGPDLNLCDARFACPDRRLRPAVSTAGRSSRHWSSRSTARARRRPRSRARPA